MENLRTWFHLDVPVAERNLSVALNLFCISDREKQGVRDKSCIVLGFRAIGGGHATASKVFSFLGLYTWDESFELDSYPPRVKFWPAAFHLSNAYSYCKMIRCYNPVAGKISKMPQKNIFFLCSRNGNFGKSSVSFQLQVGSP